MHGFLLEHLVGKTFGKWTVVRPNGRNKWGKPKILCRCLCGVEKDVAAASIIDGSSKSCGCIPHPGWNKGIKRTMPGDAAKNKLFIRYKFVAKRRGIPFLIEKQLFLSLISSNCLYCCQPPTAIESTCYPDHPNDDTKYTGIDRVDNSKGYVAGNCVPCCKHCNYAKGKKTLEDFLTWCSRIGGAPGRVRALFEAANTDKA